MKKALLVCSLICGLGGFAQAADVEQLPDVFDWSGLYVGAQVGYGWGNFADHVENQEDPFEGDIEGVLGGVHGGYNFQLDNLVLGLEVDLEASDMDGSDTPFTDTQEVDIEFLGSVRARAGIAFDNLLIYATGGLAGADVKFTQKLGAGGSGSDNVDFWGYTIGGGIEHAFSEALSARIEYRYTDLGEEDFDSSPFECIPACQFEGDIDFHAVRAGLSWHFGAM